MKYSVFTQDKDNKLVSGNCIVCDSASDLFQQLKFIKEADEDIVTNVSPYQSSAEFISASMGEQITHILGYQPELMHTYRKQPKGTYFYVVEDTDTKERKTMQFNQQLQVGREYMIKTSNNEEKKIKVMWKTR